jgi:hypothetical protein
MLTPSQIDAVIEEQTRYADARRSNTCVVRTDEPELRKAWLKRKFGSFEYHERMLEIHEAWLTLIYASLARPEVKANHPAEFAFIDGSARKNLEKAPKPGELDPALWVPGQQTGWARSILDYDRDSGLDVVSIWNWMDDEERERMFALWGAMSRMAENIQYTVDEYWFNPRKGNDDSLLNELYTGPIDWPENWLEDSRSFQTAASSLTQGKSGEPAPLSGIWQSVDANPRRVRVSAGELLPPSSSAYGTTIWRRTSD